MKPGGADFGTLRTDGIFLVEVPGALESRDGAQIEITYTGVMDLGPDGYGKFLKGEAPASAAVRAAPRFRTAHPAYASSRMPASWRGRRISAIAAPMFMASNPALAGAAQPIDMEP